MRRHEMRFIDICAQIDDPYIWPVDATSLLFSLTDCLIWMSSATSMTPVKVLLS